jgi:hypothetical protein
MYVETGTSLHFIDLIIVQNSPHPIGLGGPNIFRRVFRSNKSILFAASGTHSVPVFAARQL